MRYSQLLLFNSSLSRHIISMFRVPKNLPSQWQTFCFVSSLGSRHYKFCKSCYAVFPAPFNQFIFVSAHYFKVSGVQEAPVLFSPAITDFVKVVMRYSQFLLFNSSLSRHIILWQFSPVSVTKIFCIVCSLLFRHYSFCKSCYAVFPAPRRVFSGTNILL